MAVHGLNLVECVDQRPPHSTSPPLSTQTATRKCLDRSFQYAAAGFYFLAQPQQSGQTTARMSSTMGECMKAEFVNWMLLEASTNMPFVSTGFPSTHASWFMLGDLPCQGTHCTWYPEQPKNALCRLGSAGAGTETSIETSGYTSCKKGTALPLLCGPVLWRLAVC